MGNQLLARRKQPIDKRPLIEPANYVSASFFDPSNSASQIFWLVFSILAPLAWVALTLLISLLIKRSRDYENALVHNRELLQYAEVARTLSHEIKNPLAAIVLQSAVLRRNLQGQGIDSLPELQLIEDEAIRISALVGKVKDYLKNPLGQPELCNIWQMLDRLGKIGPTKIILTPATDPSIYVRFDPDRFRSVLENILNNAWESGTVQEPAVDIGYSKNQRVQISVRDWGQSISKNSIDKVFIPFYTTKPGGTGIGLAVVKSFTEAAGGKITLELAEGGGVRAILDLPLGTQS